MLLRAHGGGFSLTRLSRLGPTVLQAVLGRFGETGSGTGSNRADHLLFGPDLGAAGTSVGRTYLGVPRAMPIAGTDRSLGKLLRRELTDLYSADASCAAWWDPAVHPWVFCAFDKTMTAVWHGRTLLSSATPPSPPSFPPQPPPQLPPSPSSPSSPPTPTPDPHRFRLRYRWLGIVPTQGQVDPRFHLVIPSAEARAVAHRAHFVRLDKHEKCVERQMGFLGAASPLEHETAVLDTLALRVHEATAATAMAARDAETARLQARHARAAGPRGARDRTAALRHEARARRLDRLVLALHLWMDEMLDLAYWMQRAPAVRRARYVDAAPGVRRAATLLLYPHGRRFVSLYDLPDLTPWLPYTNVCIERNYWSPPGGTGGVVSTTTETTTTTHTPRKGDAGVGVGAPPRDGSGPPKMTVVATTTVHASGGGNSASAASGGSGGGGGGGGGGGRGNAPPAAASVTPQGMAALAHMVLSKSTPQPCTVRNLDQIAVRNALEDPPLGLAAMDMVHVMLLGNYEGCRVRPSFAVRARVRAQSLAFRGASSAATAAWIREHYRLIHLAFKEWYAQTAACSPAYEAVVADVQHHTEYAEFGRRAADQVRRMLACHGHPLRDPAMGPDADPIQLPPAKRLDDAAHMAHGMSLRTFGKLRKGSFVETLCDRMRSWLRALCTGKENLAQQYKEELTQMTVFSKIAYSQPAYRQRIVADIATLRNSSSQETPASHAADPQQQQQQQPQQRLDPIEPWALGAPLVTLPAALIESFLKWEGDSALGASPWFADSSFFTAEPYQYLDEDSLRAVDLAAWMCARRTDGRFATAWLRWPLGLSAQAYQRVQTLYMSYECCDVADNSFLVQLRRLLFRQRRRVVPAAEYEARRARRDPSIMYERTETIQTTRASTANAATAPRTVAYRIVEEYGTPQARRDFALVYEYANRVQAYQAWSILPLPRRIAAFQAEAVKRRQSLEPWRRTDADLLGSRHLCACGRWACCVVTPPSRPTTSSVTERRRSAPSPASTGNGTDVAPNHHHHQHHEAPAAYNVVPTRRAPTQGDALDANSSGGGDESRSNINKEGRIHDMVKRRSVLGTGYRGKSGGGAVTKMGAAATGKGSSGAVGRFDDMDLRYAASTARWASTDSEEARQDRAAMPPPSKRRRRGRRNGTPPIKGANGGCGAEAGWRDVVTVTTHNVVIPESAEPVTRDIHPASATHAIGEDFVSCDLGQERRLVSKDSVSSPHCTGRLFRVNLLGRAVRPKGPKAQSNGPWYTLCATCGALTTVDMGRWDHRGPTCGAHGRPHRLPDRLAAYDERIEGSDVSHRARSLLARAYAASDTDGTSDADDDADDDEEMEEEEMEGGWGSEMVLPPSRKLADRLRRDLSALDARAGLPCTDEVPECWSCNSAVDRRQVSAPSHEEARDWGAFGAPHSGGGRSARVVRFHVGTSVATAPIGSAGAALYARSITLSGTHQAAPVRRINIRGAMFGSLGGARGGNLLAAPPAGEHSVPRSNPHLCARGQCPCFADVVHIHQRHQLAIAEATKSDEEASAAAAAVVAMDDETFVAMGRMARRHAPLISSRVLPAELLPVVGEEVTLKVLDDVHAGSKMRLRWIYLCPVHMKDLRVGWITISGRLVQIDHQKRAKGMEDRHIQLQAPEMIRAAAGRAIGAQAIVNHLFSSVPLLSVVLRALRRGSKDRMRQLKRYGGGALQGMRTIPDFSGSRKRRAREGS